MGASSLLAVAVSVFALLLASTWLTLGSHRFAVC